jgi:hypothetical protein
MLASLNLILLCRLIGEAVVRGLREDVAGVFSGTAMSLNAQAAPFPAPRVLAVPKR